MLIVVGEMEITVMVVQVVMVLMVDTGDRGLGWR